MTAERLLDRLDAVLPILATIDLSDPGAARAELTAKLPPDGPVVTDLRALAEAGRDAGWLLTGEAGGLRFGRVAKNLEGWSVDAVLMSAPGPKHRHPRGEVSIAWATTGDPRFDGEPAGWVVYGPDSTHTPSVAGGEMLILYFLPGGAIDWLREP